MRWTRRSPATRPTSKCRSKRAEWLSVADNGRGMPVDPHPKFPGKSALEIIMTKLHAGGKFDSGAYETSGGLHGVGVSVVNALSSRVEVEVARGQTLYRQAFERGAPVTKLEVVGKAPNRRGTRVRFHPDEQIFGKSARFDPARLFKMTRAKAYLFGGVEIRWRCAPALVDPEGKVPAEATFHFPGGLKDYLAADIEGQELVVDQAFTGKVEKDGKHGSVEWAVAWLAVEDGFVHSYCNTIPTPDGGTHEAGLRAALLRGLKDHAERIGQAKRAAALTADDVMSGCAALLSVFIREPEFQGQNKGRLQTAEAARIVDAAVRDAFDHWLAAAPSQAAKLLDFAVERADERRAAGWRRTSPARRRRASCGCPASSPTAPTLPRKALNYLSSRAIRRAARPSRRATAPARRSCRCAARSSTSPRRRAKSWRRTSSSPISCRRSASARAPSIAPSDLRYDKIIIMTDADVDGAHIASLLITFFYRQTPKLIEEGHLYLAAPPLYRLTQGGKSLYARDDAHKDALMKSGFSGRGAIEVSRFKGLGEMSMRDLRDTTMDAGQAHPAPGRAGRGRQRGDRRRGRAADGRASRRRASPSSRSGRRTRASSSTFRRAGKASFTLTTVISQPTRRPRSTDRTRVLKRRTMIDWLGWLRRLEFATVAALAIAGLCLMIGQSAERFADATTASAARLAARQTPADGQSAARFDGIDYSAIGSIEGSRCRRFAVQAGRLDRFSLRQRPHRARLRQDRGEPNLRYIRSRLLNRRSGGSAADRLR